MNPGEKRALHYWLACGHSAADTPPSRYLKPCGIPDGWGFLDVYRLEKELDADTAGMDSLQKAYYLRKYFEGDISFDDPVQENPEESSLHAEEPATDKYNAMNRKLFWMWEFICSEDLCDEAEEYMKDHKEQETPFEW